MDNSMGIPSIQVKHKCAKFLLYPLVNRQGYPVLLHGAGTSTRAPERRSLTPSISKVGTA